MFYVCKFVYYEKSCLNKCVFLQTKVTLNVFLQKACKRKNNLALEGSA